MSKCLQMLSCKVNIQLFNGLPLAPLPVIAVLNISPFYSANKVSRYRAYPLQVPRLQLGSGAHSAHWVEQLLASLTSTLYALCSRQSRSKAQLAVWGSRGMVPQDVGVADAPERVLIRNSGAEGFLRVKQATAPVPCIAASKLP